MLDIITWKKKLAMSKHPVMTLCGSGDEMVEYFGQGRASYDEKGEQCDGVWMGRFDGRFKGIVGLRK